MAFLKSNVKLVIPPGHKLCCDACNRSVGPQPRHKIIGLASGGGCASCVRDGTEKDEASLIYTHCPKCSTNICVFCANRYIGPRSRGRRANGWLRECRTSLLRRT